MRMAVTISSGCKAVRRLPRMNSLQRQMTRRLRRAQFHLGVEHQQRRHAVGSGRGVAEIAGDGCDVLDLARPDLRAACLSASNAAGSGWRMRSVQVVRAPISQWVSVSTCRATRPVR